MSKLSKLFKWRKKVEILHGDKVIATAYIKLIGDNEYGEARNAGLTASKLLRVKLRNPNTEEYKATFTDVDAMDKTELVMNIVFSEMPNFRDEFMATFPEERLPDISEVAEDPDNPTLEEQEKLETKIEESRKARIEEVTKFIEEKGEERRKELIAEESMDVLRDIHKTSMINLKCTEEFSITFREYQVYKATYEDEKYTKMAFKTFDEFKESSPMLKNQLTNAYIELEVSGEDLKN